MQSKAAFLLTKSSAQCTIPPQWMVLSCFCCCLCSLLTGLHCERLQSLLRQPPWLVNISIVFFVQLLTTICLSVLMFVLFCSFLSFIHLHACTYVQCQSPWRSACGDEQGTCMLQFDPLPAEHSLQSTFVLKLSLKLVCIFMVCNSQRKFWYEISAFVPVWRLYGEPM